MIQTNKDKVVKISVIGEVVSPVIDDDANIAKIMKLRDDL